jgi:hypothetical protein
MSNKLGYCWEARSGHHIVFDNSFELYRKECSAKRTQTSAKEVLTKVKDAMHKGVDWVSPDTPITELAKLMCEHDIGASTSPCHLPASESTCDHVSPKFAV